MNPYRRPEEWQAQDEHEAQVRAVLDQVVHDGASLKAAIMLGEPPEVVEWWINAMWDGLRADLSDEQPKRPEFPGLRHEDRLMAIVLLLDERMQAEADEIVRTVRDPR